MYTKIFKIKTAVEGLLTSRFCLFVCWSWWLVSASCSLFLHTVLTFFIQAKNALCSVRMFGSAVYRFTSVIQWKYVNSGWRNKLQEADTSHQLKQTKKTLRSKIPVQQFLFLIILVHKLYLKKLNSNTTIYYNHCVHFPSPIKLGWVNLISSLSSHQATQKSNRKVLQQVIFAIPPSLPSSLT